MENSHQIMAFQFLKEAVVKNDVDIPQEVLQKIYNLISETDPQSDVNLQIKIRKIIEDIS